MQTETTHTLTHNIPLDPSELATAIQTAAAMVGVDEAPIPVPSGDLGGCVACGRTVASHFSDGRWVGCLKGDPTTVFILVPAARANAETVTRRTTAEQRAHSHGTGTATAHDLATSTHTQDRGFVRARYHSTLHHRAKPEKLHLTPVRTKVLRAVHEHSKEGLLARDIIKRTKLPHGSVQQTLNWLRHHNLVTAEEDATTTAAQ